LPRERVDAGAQRDVELLRVEMFLEHRELAAHPCIADRVVERGRRLEHEPLQALAHQQIRERVLQRRRVVLRQQSQDLAFGRGRGRFAAGNDFSLRQRVQLVERVANDLARPQTDSPSAA
jgi:hypothetical protein